MEDRVAVPDDNVERFMSIVLNMVEPFGIDQTPEVLHQVELLHRSVERYIFERDNSTSPKQKKASDRKRFIAMFKGRYLHLVDLEYTKKITPIDASIISQVIKTILENGLTIEDFMRWTFEEFLPENPKFIPPSLRNILSDFVVTKFLYDNKELAKRNRDEELNRSEVSDLTNRARVLLRSELADKDKDSLKKSVLDYRDHRIIMDELRRIIQGFEKKLKCQ